MIINWSKTIAICSPAPCMQLLGMLTHVRVLQLGEVHKYLGADHEASGEDQCIGPQLVTKIRKRCQQVQSPFHSLVTKIVILNSILLAQLWYFLAVWVPTSKDIQAIRQTMRCFLWGKLWEEGSRWSRVAWSKVVQPQEEGGLGVVDPVVKAKALQAQWVLRSLAPGDEPWKELVRYSWDRLV